MSDHESCPFCKTAGVVSVLWGVALAIDAVGLVEAADVPGAQLPDWLQGIAGVVLLVGGGASVWYNFFRKVPDRK
jgi:hypothetical protein